MNPVIAQAIVAEQTSDRRAEAAAARRARQARRTRQPKRIVPGLRALRPAPAHAV